MVKRKVTIIIDEETGEVICPDPCVLHDFLLGKVDEETTQANLDLAKKHPVAWNRVCG